MSFSGTFTLPPIAPSAPWVFTPTSYALYLIQGTVPGGTPPPPPNTPSFTTVPLNAPSGTTLLRITNSTMIGTQTPAFFAIGSSAVTLNPIDSTYPLGTPVFPGDSILIPIGAADHIAVGVVSDNNAYLTVETGF